MMNEHHHHRDEAKAKADKAPNPSLLTVQALHLLSRRTLWQRLSLLQQLRRLQEPHL